jgi:hypothetical protein
MSKRKEAGEVKGVEAEVVTRREKGEPIEVGKVYETGDCFIAAARKALKV